MINIEYSFVMECHNIGGSCLIPGTLSVKQSFLMISILTGTAKLGGLCCAK